MPIPKPSTLKQRVLRAGGWTLGGHGLGQAIRLGSNLVMTRLLVPEMFGVMAIAITVTIILNMLSDLGLRQNIVQSRRGDDPLFLDTAWVVQIGRGIALWLVAVVLGVTLHVCHTLDLLPADTAYAHPDLPLVIAISALSAIANGFQSTKMSSAYRAFQQKRVVQIALVSQIAGLVVMVTAGLQYRSIWALVAGGLVSSTMTAVLSHVWMLGHNNRFRCEKEALRELFHFGKWVFVSSGLYVFTVNGDRLLLAAFVEANVLGFFAIASLFVAAISGILNKLFFTVSLPALSEVARTDRGRLKSIYNKLCIPGDLLLMFLTTMLFASAQSIIDLLYDQRYEATGRILQILSLSLFAVRYEVARQVYLALGLPKYGTFMSILRFAALVVLVPAAYRFGGSEGAIWGVALHSLAAVPLVYYFNVRLGLADWRRELLVLPSLPAGYLFGFLINIVLR